MGRAFTWTVAIVLLLAGGAGVAWYFSPRLVTTITEGARPDAGPEDAWMDHLFSQNPKDVEAAENWVVEEGEDLLPVIERTLRSADADREQRKAALKACGLLGPVAGPLMRDVAHYLLQEDLAPEAAAALSFMGRDALAALVDGVASEDPVIRRESLRSVGKLRERAPLEADAVIPLLIGGTTDADPGVRAIAATYLGIIHERPEETIPALVSVLDDRDPAVRLAAANALAEFGTAAESATQALRKAAGDRDPEVAREAGRALVMVASVR